MPTRRVGVFGGTFDPIHIGHLVVAADVRHALGLDRMLLVVANVPWQKVGQRAISPGEDRLAVVEAAIAGVAGLEASRIELDRGGPSYAADTLAELAAADPDAELHLVVGADVAGELGTWERVSQVRALATLVVVNRPGAGPRPELQGWRVREVSVPSIGLSSTEVRARVASGRPIDFLVPAAAIQRIRALGLYASWSDRGGDE